MSKDVREFFPEYTGDPSLDQYRMADISEVHAACESEVDRLLSANSKNLEIKTEGMQKLSIVRRVAAPTDYESLEPAGYVMKMEAAGNTLLHIASPLVATKDGLRTGMYIWTPGSPCVGTLAIEGMGYFGEENNYADVALAAARLFTPRLIQAEGFNPKRQRIEQGDGRDEIINKSWLQRLRG